MDKSSVKITIESLHEIRNHPDARHQIIMICNREIERLERIAAAAPDLLEACKAALVPLVNKDNAAKTMQPWEVAILNKLKPAIAKAEGR